MNSKINDFTDLKVWQKAHKLKLLVYGIVKDLPNDEKYNLSLQIRKCVISITANIAEGHGRHHKKDTLQFLRISRGSLFELKDHLLSCVLLNLIPSDKINPILSEINEVTRLLNGYIRYMMTFESKK
jgi:four helix bundle protein